MSNKKPTYQELEKLIIELKSENKLKQSENRFNLLLKASEDMITIHKPSGEYLYYNGPTCYAITAKDIVGKMPNDLFDKEVSDILLKAFKKVAKTGNSETIEVLLDWFGEKKWFSEYIYAIKNSEEEVVELVKVCKDIHKRKIAEQVIKEQNKEKENRLEELEFSKQQIQNSLELLEKSEYSLKEASRMAKIGYWEYYIKSDRIVWSDYVCKMFGLDPNEQLPSRKEIVKLYDKASQEKIELANLNLTSKGIPYDIEVKFNNLKKEEVWVRNVVQPIYNIQNEIIGRKGVLQNITDSKNGQLELELSKQKIQNSLELLEKKEFTLNESSRIAKIGYWDYNIATDSFIWSDYVYQIFGIDLKDKLPSRKEIVQFYDIESQEKLAQATLNLTLKKIPYDIELKLTNLKKEVVWIRNVVQLIFNKENEIIGRRGVLHNITDSKKAQLELQLSKEKIQTSLDLLEKSEDSKNEASKLAKIGYLEDDIATDTFVWSEYLYHIFGFDNNQPVPSRQEIAVLFDKESQDKMEQATFNLDVNGVPFDVELKMINLRKEEVWIRIVVQPVYNKQGKIVKRRGVLQDITDSKLVQHELEISKEKIQTSLELLEKRNYSMNEASKIAKIGYWEHDLILGVVVWSEYIHHMFGSDPIKGTPKEERIFNTFNKESQEKLTKATLGLTLKGIPYDIELKLINLKKEEIWVRNVAQPIYNEKKEIVGKRGVMQNITASKKAQHELEFSRQKIQSSLDLLEIREHSLNEASKVAKIAYQEYDIATGNFVWSNFINVILGLDLKDKIPPREEVLMLLDKESQKKLKKAAEDIDLRGISCDVELKLVNFKNEEVWLRNVGQPVYNQEKEIVGRRGVLQDITESKNAQLQLELSKEKILTSLNLLEKRKYSMDESSKVAKMGYHEYDIATDTFIWSEYLYYIFGLDPSKKTLSRTEVLGFFDEKSKEKLIKATLELDLNGFPYDLELKIINKRNKEIWVRNVSQPVYNKQNEIIGRRGVTLDITEQKQKEKALDSEKNKVSELNKALNQAQKLSHVGSWQWDIKTDKAEWSDEMYNIYGVAKGSFCTSSKNVIKTVLPEDVYKIEEGINSLITGKMFVPFEFRIKRPSGEIRHLYIVALEEDNNKNIFGVTKDITERKQIEEKNLIITRRYRELFDNATVSIWNGDLSPIIEKITELRELKLPNIKIYLEENPKVLISLLRKIKINNVNSVTLKLFKAESKKEILDDVLGTFGEGADTVFANFIESIWNNERTFTSEVNYKTLKGDEFAALISIPIPQTEIEQKIVPISIQSIQSLKDAESSERDSLNKLKEAQKLTKVGSWLFDPISKYSEWSEETYRIWGFDLKKPLPNNDVISSRIHKDDRKKFNEAVSLIYSKGSSYNIEFRICLPNNVQKTIRSICVPIFDDNGEIISLKGTNQDITEQKQARVEIEKAQEMYRILTDNSKELICLHEMNSSFKYISPSMKNILGYEPSELLGKNVFGIVHKDDIDALKKKMEQRVFSGMYIDAFACRVLHKEGHFIWLEFLSSPVYKGQEISYFISSARDVTQGILAKQEIQEYQISLQKLTTEITLIEEKQKKEIATNIHDHLSQSLVISKMKINELKKNKQLKGIDEDLKFIETHISEALENSRKITYELSPPVLYQLGIIEALNWLFENILNTHKIECVINSNVNNIKLDDVKSILLYRSIQEVLTNAIKYAKASLITLDLDKNNLGLDIFITDNGIGFDTSILNNLHSHSGSGFGLFTVKERIRNIQGEFTIKSKLNIGTTVKIFIPLAK